MKFAATTLIAALLFSAPALAQQEKNFYMIKDSLYFTMDDGVQTPEEMEEEAEYVLGNCNRNAYQKQYFNCECLAGAFLLKREKLGPLTPQQEILDELTKSRSATCANTEAIAGSAYEECIQIATALRELAPDNEEYCSCSANKAALDFKKSPRLNSRYIRKVKSNALSYCENPANRTALKTSQSE